MNESTIDDLIRELEQYDPPLAAPKLDMPRQ